MATNAVSRWHSRAHRLHLRGVPVIPKLIAQGIRIVFSCDVPATVELGPDVQLMHNGLGVVLHERLRIGRGTIILSNVTIGGNGRFGDIPTIGEDVYIGTGAAVIGPVVVGDRATIGANAVVTRDVPADHLAVGVPATSRPKKALSVNDPSRPERP